LDNSINKTSTKDNKTLTQDDWDFHWVKNLLGYRQEAVMLYEYAREQMAMRELGRIPQKPSKASQFGMITFYYANGHLGMKYSNISHKPRLKKSPRK
jgi:hypothetical protein